MVLAFSLIFYKKEDYSTIDKTKSIIIQINNHQNEIQ